MQNTCDGIEIKLGGKQELAKIAHQDKSLLLIIDNESTSGTLRNDARISANEAKETFEANNSKQVAINSAALISSENVLDSMPKWASFALKTAESAFDSGTTLTANGIKAVCINPISKAFTGISTRLIPRRTSKGSGKASSKFTTFISPNLISNRASQTMGKKISFQEEREAR